MVPIFQKKYSQPKFLVNCYPLFFRRTLGNLMVPKAPGNLMVPVQVAVHHCAHRGDNESWNATHRSLQRLHAGLDSRSSRSWMLQLRPSGSYLVRASRRPLQHERDSVRPATVRTGTCLSAGELSGFNSSSHSICLWRGALVATA